jgi:uncharacterized protein YqgV (UPF0045/DUF77 family)
LEHLLEYAIQLHFHYILVFLCTTHPIESNKYQHKCIYELINIFEMYNIKYELLTLNTNTGYNIEHVFYLSK